MPAEAAPPARSPISMLPAFGIDVVLVLVFVVLGRRSHAEGVTMAGVATTWWPFLAGLCLGWALLVIGRRSRAPRLGYRVLPDGGTVWLTTLTGGMALRALADQGVAVSFVVVAAVVLACFLLGWRALYRLRFRRPAG